MPGIVKAEIYSSGVYYCARTLDIDVFTQSRTMDEAVENLRKLCGNDDPTVARIGTLHHMYGVSSYANGLWAPKNKKAFATAFGVLRSWRDLYFAAIKNGSEDALGAADMYVKRITGQPEEADVEATADEEGTVAPEIEVAPAAELGDDRENPFAQ